MLRLIPVVWTVVVAGCVFDGLLGPGAELTCDDQNPCPVGRVCGPRAARSTKTRRPLLWTI